MRRILDSLRHGYRLAVTTASVLVAGCAATPEWRVDVPSTDSDPSPSVVIRAIPFQPASDPNAPTGVELSNPISVGGARATTLSSNVDLGTHLQISAHARMVSRPARPVA
jgi:hypothetical protein